MKLKVIFVYRVYVYYRLYYSSLNLMVLAVGTLANQMAPLPKCDWPGPTTAKTINTVYSMGHAARDINNYCSPKKTSRNNSCNFSWS